MCYEPQRARTVMSLWSSFYIDFAGPGVASVFLASLTLCCVHYSFCPSLITSLTTLPVIAYKDDESDVLILAFVAFFWHLLGSLQDSTSFLHTSTTRITWIMTICHYSNCPPFPMWLSVSWAESMSSSQRNISLGSLVMSVQVWWLRSCWFLRCSKAFAVPVQSPWFLLRVTSNLNILSFVTPVAMLLFSWKLHTF